MNFIVREMKDVRNDMNCSEKVQMGDVNFSQGGQIWSH